MRRNGKSVLVGVGGLGGGFVEFAGLDLGAEAAEGAGVGVFEGKAVVDEFLGFGVVVGLGFDLGGVVPDAPVFGLGGAAEEALADGGFVIALVGEAVHDKHAQAGGGGFLIGAVGVEAEGVVPLIRVGFGAEDGEEAEGDEERG